MCDVTDGIREINDAFRQSFVGGLVLATEGVNALPRQLKEQVFARVREHSTFDPDDDPCGEHAFGCFEVEGQWKIDYHDGALQYGSEDPSDPEQTIRVLTIMLKEEY